MATETITDKQRVRALIDQLPDDVSFDAIIEEVLFLQTILERLAGGDAADSTIPHEEVMKDLAKWRKSYGLDRQGETSKTS